MDRIFSPRGWQIMGAIVILFGVFTAFFGDRSQSVIFFGGGSAMILLLGREKPTEDDGSEGHQ